jgi:hypothetical protein
MLHQTKRLIDATLKHLPAIATGLSIVSGLLDALNPKPGRKRLVAPKPRKKSR